MLAETADEANLKDAERLAEALELAETANSDLRLYHASKVQTDARGEKPPPKPPTNPLLLGLSPSQYLLRTLRRIPSSGLEEALIILPLASMLTLFGYFERWLQDAVQVRCPLYDMHHPQLGSSRARSLACASQWGDPVA